MRPRHPGAIELGSPHTPFLKLLNKGSEAGGHTKFLVIRNADTSLVYFWKIPVSHYLAVLFGFGLTWSAMQYAHHYGTVRDVQKGAMNLKTFRLLDLVWLNHNWHLNHHMHPTVPWLYLPRLAEERGERRGSLLLAYLREWRGPQPSPPT